MNNYMVDTSIWIDYFRGRSQVLKDRVIQLLSENVISFNGIILSELMIGARTRQEQEFICDNFEGLHYLDMNRDFFKYASEIGNRVQKKGKKIPLSDLLILAHAKKHGLIIFTCDKHFESLGKSIGFQYEIFKDS